MKVKSDLKRIAAGEDSYKVIFGNDGNILSTSERRAVLANQGKQMFGTENEKEPLFECQECGKKFYTTESAEKASTSDKGCPGCGGSDIDVYVKK